MLRWFFRRKLDAEEKRLGVSVEYLRHILNVSPVAFLRFASIMPFANSRSVLPKEVWFTAQIISLLHEDCGPCLQIAVNLAQQAGVAPALLQALLNDERTSLTPEIQQVVDFTRAAIKDDDPLDTLRETMRTKYGERGLIELAYAIASSHIPPMVKRVLGYATSCSQVQVKVH